MKLYPVRIPAGVFRNGTEYMAKGRFYDANLVRWYAGTLRPMGGWQRLTTTKGALVPQLFTNSEIEVCRDVVSWSTAGSRANGMFGTNRRLFHLSSDYIVRDVTPAFFQFGPVEPDNVSSGYGTGSYGTGFYGTPRFSENIFFSSLKRWRFSVWNRDMLASFCPVGQLYSFDAEETRAVAVPNAPSGFNDFIVTNERFVMCIGTTLDPNMVTWSDRENREVWEPLDTNEAGNQPLQSSGVLLRIGLVRDNIFIVGDDAFAGRYQGPPFVYGFDRVGSNCRPIDANAVVFTNTFAVWLGLQNFWIYDGALRPLKCDVIDWLTSKINKDKVSKISAWSNSAFNEIWWVFQQDGDDLDTYVVWDYAQDHWNIGKINRTAGMDRQSYSTPIYVGREGVIYRHEIEAIVPNNTYAETGPIEVEDGSNLMALQQVIPDGNSFGDFSLKFLTRDFPTSTERVSPAIPFANPMYPSVLARQIRMRVEGEQARWELGTLRFAATIDGAV